MRLPGLLRARQGLEIQEWLAELVHRLGFDGRAALPEQLNEGVYGIALFRVRKKVPLDPGCT